MPVFTDVETEALESRFVRGLGQKPEFETQKVFPGPWEPESGGRKGGAPAPRNRAGAQRGPQVQDSALRPASCPHAAWRCRLRFRQRGLGGTGVEATKPLLCTAPRCPRPASPLTRCQPRRTAPPSPGHRKHHPSPCRRFPEPARKGSECSGFLWSPPGCQGPRPSTPLPLAPMGRPSQTVSPGLGSPGQARGTGKFQNSTGLKTQQGQVHRVGTPLRPWPVSLFPVRMLRSAARTQGTAPGTHGPVANTWGELKGRRVREELKAPMHEACELQGLKKKSVPSTQEISCIWL